MAEIKVIYNASWIIQSRPRCHTSPFGCRSPDTPAALPRLAPAHPPVSTSQVPLGPGHPGGQGWGSVRRDDRDQLATARLFANPEHL